MSDNSDGNKRGEMEKKRRAQAMAKVCESFSAVIPFLPISPYFYDLFYILLSFFLSIGACYRALNEVIPFPEKHIKLHKDRVF